jgi:hypothetical protein
MIPALHLILRKMKDEEFLNAHVFRFLLNLNLQHDRCSNERDGKEEDSKDWKINPS